MFHTCVIILELSLTIAAAKYLRLLQPSTDRINIFVGHPPNNVGPKLACYFFCLFLLFYMVYKDRMVISFIPLHARMTWHAHVVFFMGSKDYINPND